MSKLLGLLLLTTLALGNVHQEPLDGVVECLATFLPKLAQDVKQIYADFQTQNIAGLIADVQATVADSQAIVACVKTQSIKALEHKATEQAVKNVAECISEKVKDIKYDIEKLQNDAALGYYISLLQDVQNIFDDTQALFECVTGGSSTAGLSKAFELKATEQEVHNVAECISEKVKDIKYDIERLQNDAALGYYISLLQDVQNIYNDTEALLECVTGGSSTAGLSKASEYKAAEQTVQNIVECISEEIQDIKDDIEKLQNDATLGNYISLIGDVQDILNDTQSLVQCVTGETPTAELRKVIELMSKKDPTTCVFRYLPALTEDAANLLADVQKGDYASLQIHIESFSTNIQALATCLST